jgi:endonuclease G
MKRFIFLALLGLVSFAQAECNHLYPNGKALRAFGSTELCNSFYVAQYDESGKRVLFVSELLSPGSHDVPRLNAFKGDRRLREPVKPSEYLNSGYDKGHMVPADDATNQVEMLDTFLMTNMTPQHPKLNRGSWKKLEALVRRKVANGGVAKHVITGALYESQEFMKSVPIPSGYYKIAYYSTGTEAYYAANNSRSGTRKVKVAWINAKTNMEFPQE